MKIHEYQAKALFKAYGIPTPDGEVAEDAAQALAIFNKLQLPKVVVKAQIHAGGRGKGGGVKLAGSAEDFNAAVNSILGMQLITHQTGPEGQKVRKVLIEAASAIEKELYLSIILDRATAMPVIMASTEGGMDIEEVAEKTPEKILKEWIDPAIGLQAYQARKLGYKLGFSTTCSGKKTVSWSKSTR
jgi:succinyl-CoA synthetase beta subunit